jgi:SAM-dependent methyltransferase
MGNCFDETKSTSLCEIMGKYGSDKGCINITQSWHNYTTAYYSLFNKLRDKPLRIFELGLGTNNLNIPSNMGVNGKPGASLYGWRDFFLNSNIFGADIDMNILFKADRIETFYCDQTNPYIINQMWNNSHLQEDFDIIIDDGLHKFAANVCFFENSIHKLKPDGYYIIEDIRQDEEQLFEDKIKEWEIKYTNCHFQLLRIPSPANNFDNAMCIISKLRYPVHFLYSN